MMNRPSRKKPPRSPVNLPQIMKIFAILKPSPEMPENMAKALKISAAANLAPVSGNGDPAWSWNR